MENVLFLALKTKVIIKETFKIFIFLSYSNETNAAHP